MTSPPRLQRRSVSGGAASGQQSQQQQLQDGSGVDGVDGGVPVPGPVSPALAASVAGHGDPPPHNHRHHYHAPPSDQHHHHPAHHPHRHLHPQLSTPLAAHLTNLAHLSTVITPGVVYGGAHHAHRPHHHGGMGAPVVSPFRMVPSPVHHRRVKAAFGLCVAVVICGVAPLELRRVWIHRRARTAAAAATVMNGGMSVVGDGGTVQGEAGRRGPGVSTHQQQQQQQQQQEQQSKLFQHAVQQEGPSSPSPPIARDSDSDPDPSPSQRGGSQQQQRGPPPSAQRPDPGPFARRAYRDLRDPDDSAAGEGLFRRLSRRLLALRLRISSRRNERHDTGRRQRRRRDRQEVVAPYAILNSEDLYDRMSQLAEAYPELVTLENAQDKFGLGGAGGPDDCPFEAKEKEEEKEEAAASPGCRNWFLTIEDGVYNSDGPDDSSSSPAPRSDPVPHPAENNDDQPEGHGHGQAGQSVSAGGDGGGRHLDESNGERGATTAAAARPSALLPEVFISGALHGDERVGPTAAIEAAALLLESAWCESLPRVGGRTQQQQQQQQQKAAEPAGWVAANRTSTRRRRRIIQGGEDGLSSHKEDGNDFSAEDSADDWRRRRGAQQQEEEEEDRRRADEEADWDEAVAQARACRSSLSSRGIHGPARRWLARLVSTRRIVVLPAANALGYYRRVRHEGDDADLDPNRDFPYDLTDGTMCMRTIAGRTINELFRDHVFQIGVTYHGGMEAVAYEWGAPSYQIAGSTNAAAGAVQSYAAPDEASQEQISSIYSSYGGKFTKNGGNLYPVGTMNSLVYPVCGSMEDWSYAASWDTDRVASCRPEPTKNGGYPEEKTRYGPSELRTFTALVETSNDKTPREEDLGTNEDLLTPFGAGNGHISRNIRLTLAAIDLVEPYVQIFDAAGREIRDDVVPLSPRRHRSCTRTKVLTVPEGTRNVTVGWAVGGAVTVDSTALMVGRWDDLADDVFDCLTQPTKQELDSFFAALDERAAGGGNSEAAVKFAGAQGPGPARWSDQLRYPDPSSSPLSSSTSSSIRNVVPEESIFRSKVDLSSFVQGDSVAVYALARVDQGWMAQDGNVLGNVPPQTHLVNSRTNPDWRHESSGRVVQGRLDWFSVPLTIEIGAPRGPTVEKSVRSPDDEWEPDQMTSGALIKALLLGSVLAIIIVGCVLFRENSDGTDAFAVWREHQRIEAEALPTEEYAVGTDSQRENGYNDEEVELPTYEIS